MPRKGSDPAVKHAFNPWGARLCEIRKPGTLWGVNIDWRGVDCSECLDMHGWNGPHPKETVPGDSAT